MGQDGTTGDISPLKRSVTCAHVIILFSMPHLDSSGASERLKTNAQYSERSTECLRGASCRLVVTTLSLVLRENKKLAVSITFHCYWMEDSCVRSPVKLAWNAGSKVGERADGTHAADSG